MRGRRRRLESLRGTLLSFGSVPASARAFHRARRVLEEDLEHEAARLLPWGGGDAMTELEERVSRLEPLAEGLRDLITRSEQDRVRLAGWQGTATEHPSSLETWILALSRLGEAVRSPADLEIEGQQLEQIRAEMATLIPSEDEEEPSPPSLPPTSSPSPPLARAAKTPALQPWSSDTETSSPEPPTAQPSGSREPVTETAGARTPAARAPGSSQRLEELGQHLWEWASVLPAHRDAVGEISRRKEDAALRSEEGAKGSGSSATLLDDAERLLTSITAAAAAERRTRRKQLESQVATLARHLEQGDLEGPTNALLERRVERGREHQSWLAESGRLEGLLRDRVHNGHRRVAEAFELTVRELRTELEDLGNELLSERAAAELRSLLTELQDLAAATGVEARFQALDRLGGLGARLARCRDQVREGRAELRRRRRSLETRLEALSAVQTVLPDFTPVEPALHSGAGAGAESLEAAQAALDRLETALAAEEERFVESCRIAHRRLAEEGRGLAASLDLASSLDLLEPGGVPSAIPASVGGDPAAAAEALAASRRRHLRLETARGEALEAALAGLAPALEELEVLEEARLRAGDRRERAALIEGATRLSAAPHADDCGAELEDLLVWLRRGADLVDRVEGPRRRFLRRRRQLVSRLETFEGERLADCCPRNLVERAHALVHGLEAEAEDPSAGAQLAAAETLLGRLERHARLRVADRMERASGLLAGDPAPAARAALAELAATPADRLPPPALRRRLETWIPDEETP